MQEKWRDVPSDILEAQGKAFSRMGPAPYPCKTTNEKKNKNKVQNTEGETVSNILFEKKLKPNQAP